MAWDDSSDRTEAASRRRREEARQQGRVTRSGNLTAALMMGGATGVLSAAGPSFVHHCAQLLSVSLRQQPIVSVDDLMANGLAMSALSHLAYTGFTIVGCLWLLACGANLLQTGPLLTIAALHPRVDRMSPLAGIARLMSVETLVRGGFAGVQFLGVAALVGWSLRANAELLAGLPALTTVQGAFAIGTWLKAFGWKLATLLVVLSTVEYSWQRWRLEQSLRMTKQEVRDEQHDVERRKPQRRGQPHASLSPLIDVERV